MSTSSKTVKVGTFDELARLLASNKEIVIDFFASWCGPCRQLAPTYEAMAVSNPTIVFVKVDCDESGELAAHYQIKSLPTLIHFAAGRETGRVQGARLRELKELVLKATGTNLII